jgi:hypothetical protein
LVEKGEKTMYKGETGHKYFIHILCMFSERSGNSGTEAAIALSRMTLKEKEKILQHSTS